MGRVPTEQPDQAPISTHFSHPHPLKLSNLQLAGQVSSCSACKLEVTGQVYSCTAGTNFNLHPKCYDLPQQIKHEFDKNHVLILHPKPVYPEGMFNCDACGHRGEGFSYNCIPCGADFHSTCASLPMVLTHHCHDHELKLNFSAPYPGNSFSCDVCKRVSSKTWMYRCEDCEFDVHLTCVAEIIPKVSVQMRGFMPQVPQITSRSISQNGMVMNNPSGYGSPMMRPQQPQYVANAYPAAMAPPMMPYNNNNNMNQPGVMPPMMPYNNNLNQPGAMPPMMPYHNNLNKPSGYGGVGPGGNNGGMGTQIAAGVAEGVASGVAQSLTQNFMQGIMGGGGGGAAGVAAGGGGGEVIIVDGGSYYDGGYGGADAGTGGDSSW